MTSTTTTTRNKPHGKSRAPTRSAPKATPAKGTKPNPPKTGPATPAAAGTTGPRLRSTSAQPPFASDAEIAKHAESTAAPLPKGTWHCKHPLLRRLDVSADINLLDAVNEHLRRDPTVKIVDLGGKPGAWAGAPVHYVQPSRGQHYKTAFVSGRNVCSCDAEQFIASFQRQEHVEIDIENKPSCTHWRDTLGTDNVVVIMRHVAENLQPRELAALSKLPVPVYSMHWYYATENGAIKCAGTNRMSWYTSDGKVVVSVRGDAALLVSHAATNSVLNYNHAAPFRAHEIRSYALDDAVLTVCRLGPGVRMAVPTPFKEPEQETAGDETPTSPLSKPFLDELHVACLGLKYDPDDMGIALTRARHLLNVRLAKGDVSVKPADLQAHTYAVMRRIHRAAAQLDHQARVNDSRATAQRREARRLGYGYGWTQREWALRAAVVALLAVLAALFVRGVRGQGEVAKIENHAEMPVDFELCVSIFGLVLLIYSSAAAPREFDTIWARCLSHVPLKEPASQHGITHIPLPGKCRERVVGFWPHATLAREGGWCYYTGCVHNELLALCNRHLARVLTPAKGFWRRMRTTKAYLYPRSESYSWSFAAYLTQFKPARQIALRRAQRDDPEDSRLSSFVKHELSKGVEVATRARLIQGTALGWQGEWGPRFAGIMDWLKLAHDGVHVYRTGQHAIIPVYTGGLNGTSLGRLYSVAQATGATSGLDGDASEFDASKSQDACAYVAHTWSRLGRNGERVSKQMLRRAKRLTGRTMSGIRYYICGTQPSGQSDTSCGNYVANVAMITEAIERAIAGLYWLFVQGDDFFVKSGKAQIASLAAVIVQVFEEAGFRLTIHTPADGHEEFCSGYFPPVGNACHFATKAFRAISKFHIRVRPDAPLALERAVAQAAALVRTSTHIPVLAEYAASAYAALSDRLGYHVDALEDDPLKFTADVKGLTYDDHTLEWFAEHYDLTATELAGMRHRAATCRLGEDLGDGDFGSEFRRCLAVDLG